MSQTTAPAINMSKGFAGLLGDSSDNHARTGFNAGVLYLGRLVSLDTASGEDGVKHPAAAGDITTATVAGVVGHSHAFESTPGDGLNPAWPAKSAVPVVDKGYIWVVVEEAVSRGADAFARHTVNGGLDQLGAFRSDADTANAVAVPNARFESSTTGAGIALLAINMP